MPPPFGRGPHDKVNDQYRVPKPKSIKEVPGYLKTIISNFFHQLFYTFKLVWDAKHSVLFLMLFMSIFNGVTPVIGSLIGKEILNKLAEAYNGELTTFTVITGLLIVQFAYMFVTNIIGSVYNIAMRISGQIVSNHIKVSIMKKAKTIDVARYDSPEFYAKMENANREAGNRPIEMMRSTFSIVSTIISAVSFIAILVAINPIAPLLIILISIPSTIINFIYRRKNVNFMFRRSKDRRQMDYYSQTIVNKDLVKEVRMFDLSDEFCDRYQSVFDRYFKGLKKLILSEAMWNIGATVLTTAVNCALFIYLARGVYEGAYEIGNYSLYTGALSSIASCVSTLISTTAGIYEGTLFINNVMTFMNEEPTIVPMLDKPRDVLRHVGHRIEFRNVSFHYPGVDRNVLKNINLVIEPGETVVIVGLNGAGKTTLIKLLTRLYDPTEGTILLDGHDIREYDVKQLYSVFGIIFQDFGKYAVNVSENIAFGQIDKKMDMDEVISAAAQSDACDFIDALPDKYETPLMRYFEDNGIELSIGQWQKVAIARAFYRDSDILVLDEPTASLDPMAEQEIFNQFETLRKDKTTFFVSHRLSSATTASKIIVLEYGELIEVGNHSELMKKRGRYYELFSTQAKRYVSKDLFDGPPPPPPPPFHK